MLPRRAVALQVTLGALIALIVVAFVQTSRSPSWAYGLAPLAALVVIGFGLRRSWLRWHRSRTPFPESWRETLQRRVPFYRRLDPQARARFELDVRIFLDEQTIYAAGGGTSGDVDESTRVLIAASAAMLGHGRPDMEWPTVRDIVVYPTRFDEDYGVGEHGNIGGMVHAQGPVLLSKDDLVHGFRRPHDGNNVALHELAHVLDFKTGAADGLPVGVEFVVSAPWVSLVADRLEKVRARKYRHVLRNYAGTNEAEFFAVAVEVFFERPSKLRDRDPELYDMLRDYFGVDTAELFAGPERADSRPA